MKFVHQECLEEWLSHSNRKHCDICNFKYNFTPIYNPETPNQISLNFFTSILFRKAVKALKFYLRCILAVSLWLIVLPFLTTAIWRFWFDPKGMFDIKARAKNSTFVQGSVNVSNLTQFTPLSDTFNASNPKVTVVPLDNVGCLCPF
ncbi:hypothetical protein BCR33DRAFT_328754 [Rhizoclosmatium globosum]|uniref:RING-type E3 ubiquitin transferase n=1 Tax=Rhizoclosmatium globosum TaxID=329046 RepID=A0A1Y2C4J9_9FUNG|nr:hypothetical protein BCR33DRAFT_328754 [Rhizoclosmatium globosum]|eukprot:ORY41953.1 hypothetical protein BCR33DRAFT_328754 [Rhizoclosmatium globosum]